MAEALISIPGASKYYKGSVVSYVNEIKESLLGVDHDLLIEKGAVSEEVAIEMVKGACKALNTTYAISITGFAVPGGDRRADGQRLCGHLPCTAGVWFSGPADRRGTDALVSFDHPGHDGGHARAHAEKSNGIKRHRLTSLSEPVRFVPGTAIDFLPSTIVC